jgi:ArsR family transcriptional regulator
MAYNKKDKFGTDYIRLAELAKALSHPARIAILAQLAKRNTCICGEIVEVIPLAQSTVSQHLKELKKAGLIKGEVDGPRSCYCINREILKELKGSFAELIGELSVDCCTTNK